MTFDELGTRWLESERHRLKDSTVKRHQLSLKMVSPFFLELLIITSPLGDAIHFQNHPAGTVPGKPAAPPREQFQSIISATRAEPQGKGGAGAGLVKLLRKS